MKASIIIPTKNPGNIFENVLNQVLSQKTSFFFEVLIIDSGSTDGTLGFVRKISDPRVKLHCIPSDSFGHGKTRNLGVALTSGEYAVLLTHDATPVDQCWLAELVDFADRDPQIAGVFGRHIAYSSAGPFARRELELHFSGFDPITPVSMEDCKRYEVDLGYRQLLHFFSDNNALIRRSVWQKIPYPDVNFAEDQLWAKAIIEAGYKKAYSDKAAVYHSHDYSLTERFQRSFDESYAFKRLFNYYLCISVLNLIRSWLALTVRDFAYAKQTGLWSTNTRAVLLSPFDNLMRVSGHYFGTKGDKLPNRVRELLSWDHRLLSGLRHGNK
jgi:rhamnosyltransferase